MVLVFFFIYLVWHQILTLSASPRAMDIFSSPFHLKANMRREIKEVLSFLPFADAAVYDRISGSVIFILFLHFVHTYLFFQLNK